MMNRILETFRSQHSNYLIKAIKVYHIIFIFVVLNEMYFCHLNNRNYYDKTVMILDLRQLVIQLYMEHIKDHG
jgi:hypothetical protein